MERDDYKFHLPEALAAKVDRLAKAEGITPSELVEKALQLYLSQRDTATDEENF